MATWQEFNFIDGIVGLLLLAGLLGGIRRGLSGELIRAVLAVAALVAALLYTRPLADWAMARWQLDARPAMVGGFLAIFLGIYLAVTAARVLLGRLADFTFRGKIERLGGALCGLARAAVVSSLILLLLGLAPNENLHRLVLQESVCGRLVSQHLRPLYDQIFHHLPEIQVPAAAETMVEQAESLYEISAQLMEDAVPEETNEPSSELPPLEPVPLP